MTRPLELARRFLDCVLPVRNAGRRPEILFFGLPDQDSSADDVPDHGERLLLSVWRSRLRKQADLTLLTRRAVSEEPGLIVVSDAGKGPEAYARISGGAEIFCAPLSGDRAREMTLAAMSAGLPVLAPRGGSVAELVLDGETGFLVDYQDPETLAVALTRLTAEPQLRERLGRAGYRYAQQFRADGGSVRPQSVAGEPGPGVPVATDPVAGKSCAFRIHRVIDDELEAQWQELAARCGTRFAARPSYALSWFEVLGKGRLAVATFHRGDRLVGVFPLHVRKRLGIPSHRWLGHGLGTVGEAVVEDPAVLDELLAGLRRAGVQLELTHVAENSPVLAALTRSAGWAVEYREDDHCPVITVPAGTTVRDLRSAKTLRRFRVARKRAAEDYGPVEFVRIQSSVELREHWPDLLRVVSAALQGNPGKRLNFFAGRHTEFTRRFLSSEAESGHLVVNALSVDSTWVAFDALLQTGTRAEGWLTFFDPAYRKYIPGHLLTERLIDIHDDLGITEIDQMIGRNPYKQDWQTSEYEVGTVRAVPAGRAWLLPVTRRMENGIAAARTGSGRLRGNLVGAARRLGRPRT